MHVLLIEPREVIRRGLLQMTAMLPFVEGVDDVETADQAGEVLDRTADGVDVVLINQGADVDALVGALEERGLGPRLVMLLTTVDPSTLTTAIRMHAQGYLVLSDLTLDALGRALTEVAGGRLWMPPELGLYLLEHARGDHHHVLKANLTSREGQVLTLLAEGLSNQQIAQRLRISVHGAKRHVSSILSKLGCPNRAHAVAVALQGGIVGLPPDGAAIGAIAR